MAHPQQGFTRGEWPSVIPSNPRAYNGSSPQCIYSQKALKTVSEEPPVLRRASAAVLLLIISLGLAGCPERRSIADIMKDPARYANNDVTVVGTVTRSFGAMGTGVYEIDDGTGKMWVFAERTGVPSEGARVAARGRVMPTLTFAGRSFATVLREFERKR